MAGGPPLKSVSGRVDQAALHAGYWPFARDDLLLYFTAVLGIVLPGCMYLVYSRVFHWWHVRRRDVPFSADGEEAEADSDADEQRVDEARRRRVRLHREDGGGGEGDDEESVPTVNVFFASETGAAKELAVRLVSNELCTYRSTAVDLATVDSAAFMATEGICLFVAATFVDGEPPDACKCFFDQLAAAAGRAALSRMKYAVFGLGSSMYDGNYNTVAKRLHESLRRAGARPFITAALGDECKAEDMSHQFSAWSRNVLALVSDGGRLERASAAIERSGKRAMADKGGRGRRAADADKRKGRKKKAKHSDSESDSGGSGRMLHVSPAVSNGNVAT